MSYLADIISDLGENWIPLVYAEKIRPQRTRSFEMHIAERENKPEILHTLLGIDLKVGNRRFSCPDLATARYLRVFARVGCLKVAIPYDITKISTLADDFEVGWHKMILLIDESTKTKTPQTAARTRSSVVKQIRNEIKELGAGETMPEFKQSTRQRNK